MDIVVELPTGIRNFFSLDNANLLWDHPAAVQCVFVWLFPEGLKRSLN
jgi:hypothetical protein